MAWHRMTWLRPLAVSAAIFVTALSGAPLASASAPASAPEASASLVDQIVQAVNQDRTGAGLSALTVDPRLSAVAQQRGQFLVDHHFFSHCSGGEDDLTCPQSGLDITPRMVSAGLGVNVPGTTIAENLALNNYPAANPDTAAALTNTAWLNSPEHKANIMDGRLSYTGVAIVCCWSGTFHGTTITAADQASIIVQDFSGGPGATPPTTVNTPAPTNAPAPTASAPAPTTTSGSPSTCHFVLGFATMAAAIPDHVGTCTDEEGHNPVNGDALQHSTGGLLVWRKADNWTAFTDGYHSWVNGPYGIMERLNTQRFSWEANPDGLPVAS